LRKVFTIEASSNAGLSLGLLPPQLEEDPLEALGFWDGKAK
jgi:hypothetical protein